MKQEPGRVRCWRCGNWTLSDSNAIEFRYDKWISELKPMKGAAIICYKCFKEHITKAFNGLQEVDFE